MIAGQAIKSEAFGEHLLPGSIQPSPKVAPTGILAIPGGIPGGDRWLAGRLFLYG